VNTLIIGAGHNGLVTAFYLAKAGLKPTVLEARDDIGGGAVTGELHPGFTCPTLTHEALLHAEIVREMDLVRHGLEVLPVDTEVCAPVPDGRPVVLYNDVARSVNALRSIDSHDAEAYAGWCTAAANVASVLAKTFTVPPPDIDRPGGADLWNLLKAGLAFRGLDKRDAYRLLRWVPMPVADLVHEWFEHEPLRAAIAARGVSGVMLGPWSAGSSLVLLMREAHRQLAGGRSLRVRGGPGALIRALADAARAAGAEIKTGMKVERLVVRHSRVAGVVVNGHELPASRVASSADPKTTLLKLVDPGDLEPEFAARVRNYRSAGVVAKVNLALSALPAFHGITDPARELAGRIHLGPEVDYLERAFDHAKYGEMSAEPWLEMTIPSLLEPQLAPAGAHVASIYVHYAPYRLRSESWDGARSTLLQSVLRVIDRHAPGTSALVVHAQVLTPLDLERDYGFTGGHFFHGELTVDQLFTMRPVIGYGRYETPIDGLFVCGAGSHPGGFLTGASGKLAARTIVRSAQGQRANGKGQRQG
jgi:phytoene dehydrogenase-like protein